MSTYKELNQVYKNLYNKNFPQATLSKWVREGKIKAIKNGNFYDYDIQSFKTAIMDSSYKIKMKKQKPQNYIGKTIGYLQVVGIVPQSQKKQKYNGNLMYCKCLKCNRQDLVQVRFSYLTPNGNYFQSTCGCGRKQRAFLASSREGIKEEWLSQFSQNFQYYLFLHKLLTSCTDGYYVNCDISDYEYAIEFLNNNNQLKKVYKFWKSKQKNNNTYYDWAKPSLDHIIPKSRGGSNKIENLQILTVFENLAKRDMTWQEWCKFKIDTHTVSDYFIQNILKQQDNFEGDDEF